ncbi:MAG: AAA family ATPase [Geobacteraceae bacterium]|nr:AAA family ATPase [Geobacteraceae bacterium]
MTNKAAAYRMDIQPIILKELAVRCNINQGDLADHLGVSRTSVNLTINRGYIPARTKNYQSRVEAYLLDQQDVSEWLIREGYRINDIWNPLGKRLHRAHPKSTWQPKKRTPAMAPGNPEAITIQMEVEMIQQEAMKHFKLFRNPFIDDIQKDADIYMSDEHRYIEAAMLDAARHGGFMAVIGEVGSGKSVIRRKIIEQLKRDGDMLVIYPQTIDKARLTAGSICDAIIYDISSEKAKVKLEDKSRQVQRLLLDRAKSGYRACLIIEEAHDLSVQTLKFLKRFYELEDGYRKLLGIILIGQTELKEMFDEGQHVDMREVIRRVQIAEIKGLNGNLRDYLNVKFKRIGAKPEDIFDEEAYEAFSRRLTSTGRDGKTRVSHAYPLLVNNYVARALNLAHEMGETKITSEVVEAI